MRKWLKGRLKKRRITLSTLPLYGGAPPVGHTFLIAASYGNFGVRETGTIVLTSETAFVVELRLRVIDVLPFLKPVTRWIYLNRDWIRPLFFIFLGSVAFQLLCRYVIMRIEE